MAIDDRTSTSPTEASADPKAGPIKATVWEHFDTGTTVVSADGNEIGTVRERMPQYLELRAEKNLLSDVELYIPREFVDRIEDDRVVLNRTSAELEELNLSTPPALQ